MSQITLDDLLEGPPGRVIARISLMTYSGLFLASFMGLVEGFFIARLGRDALAAFGFTMTMYGVIFGLALSLGAGVRATVARCLGSGDRTAVALTVSTACACAVPSFGLLGLLGAVCDQAVYAVSGASPLHVALAETFMLPVWCLAPAMGVTIVVTCALQAIGDLKGSLWTIVAILPSNLLLTPMLMFGFGPMPALGMLGAGIAAALSWVICGGLGLWFLRKQALVGRITDIRRATESMRPVLQIALPVSVGHMAIPLSTGLLTGIVAALGPSAVAAFAALARITDFVVMGINALGTGVHVVAAACDGAGKHSRIPRVITLGAMFCFVWGAACALLLTWGAQPIARLFASDPQVMARTEQFLRQASANYAFFATAIVISSALSAVHRPREGLVLNLIAVFFMLLPITYFSTRAWGWTGYCAGSVISRVAAAALSVAWLHYDKLLDTRVSSLWRLRPA